MTSPLSPAVSSPPTEAAPLGTPATVEQAFLAWVQSPDRTRKLALPVAVVVAHPDDEVIGLGAHLPRLSHLTLIHSTNGSPRSLADANRAGCATREAYAALRRDELKRVLELAEQGGAAALCLGFGDQELSSQLVAATRQLTTLWSRAQPTLILTHPYEGGHPDHDATAFVVHAACALLERDRGMAPALLEMASYYNQGGRIAVGGFLDAPGTPSVTRLLSFPEQHRKARLFAAYASQGMTLAVFSRTAESFRPAPVYDFRAPPHSGRLYYELFDWGMTGQRWRELAAEALCELDLAGPI